MDMRDIDGNEASGFLSRKFPQWRLSSSLKCLAAKALLRSGYKYKKARLPARLVNFIETHKEGDSEGEEKEIEEIQVRKNGSNKRKILSEDIVDKRRKLEGDK